VDLAVPLATLLGLAQRPGEGHGLGPLDPGLCRELAGAAIHSPWTRLCVTVTTPDGIATGHGCARPARPARSGASASTSHPAAPALPARLNLTIPAARLTDLASTTTQGAPPGQPPWSFTPDSSTDSNTGSTSNTGSSTGPPGG
jgi:hypothetical protein